ncbi:hypothetical protein LCGC14_1348320 [marine sediment metagenome]|uniref:Uncharacterized protein n=1 Tax=marine sediment metagenome TaxID=412755 RepID=A0A0F9KC94_9ZZZZ
MDSFFIIAVQTTTIVSAIVIVSVRIEHRLTKVETEINWLKRLVSKNNCCNESEGAK